MRSLRVVCSRPLACNIVWTSPCPRIGELRFDRLGVFQLLYGYSDRVPLSRCCMCECSIAWLFACIIFCVNPFQLCPASFAQFARKTVQDILELAGMKATPLQAVVTERTEPCTSYSEDQLCDTPQEIFRQLGRDTSFCCRCLRHIRAWVLGGGCACKVPSRSSLV